MGSKYHSQEVPRKAPRLRVLRNSKGEWVRRCTTSASTSPSRRTSARPSTRRRQRSRTTSPRVRHTSETRSRIDNRDRVPIRNSRQVTPEPQRCPVPIAPAPREVHLARMVLCTTFARLVSLSQPGSVIALAEKLLRRKVTSPLEAFLSLSLSNAQAQLSP